MVSSFLTVNADVRGLVTIGDRLKTNTGDVTPKVSRIEWDVGAEHTVTRYDDSGTTAGTIDGSTVATFAGIEGRIFFSEVFNAATSTGTAGLQIYGKGTA